ncbi:MULTISPECIES: hypothetical protein [Pseudomonas]|uniref:Uncharacterized protein n=3 Tax=Pseudomonas TaxID=286 RepID=A0A2R7UL01_PSEDL|nr:MULTISPECIES: hypothetical protein [Pseudomonas]MRF43538.1 hypothetical protein [Escherichia coli]KKO14313.1 hypothetical protein V520_18445 [Pseudomonas putida KG-4]MBF8647120.1 hypothetical protein [Pseudomonas pudica]MBF8701748.1 hypothetical protein [Pseudomonas putida]MBF8736506.1 hypothetical protein [Pseudomonas putida]
MMCQQRPTENSFKIEPTRISFSYLNQRKDSLRCTINTNETTYETEISEVLVPLMLMAREKINDETTYVNMWAENADSGGRNITITSLGINQL